MMQENQYPQKQQQDILYVYDRICRKESKTRQILQEYGPNRIDVPDVQPNMRTERPFPRANAPG